ncbi:MAG: RNA 2',3'-cyclic phosphodiesterase [Elusimicrobia bacterium]|jgi:2'-5' RNA ligase|nr:RNA 2',3'-cyclic phosphodiesterase [Elusimicrobiota bacterium]
MRFFIAVELPAPVKREVLSFIKKLKKYIPRGKIKWAKNENMHITVKFIGETSCSVENIKKEMLGAAGEVKPGRIIFNKTGVFTKKRPRVLWIGAPAKNQTLKNLNEILNFKLARLGVREDDKQFMSHITLGRIKKQPADLKFIRKFLTEKIKFPEIKIDKVSLFKSFLKPAGAEHRIIYNAKLKD